MGRRLLTGGIVWAGAACTPRAAWVLVDGDRIAAIAEEGRPGAARPPADQHVDLKGGHVLPGFVDVHLHLSQAAWFPLGVDGLGWASLADALHAVRVQAAADSDAPWLLFWRVARWTWPEGRLPTAAELDEAAPGRRVLVSTLDMHRGAVSSAGLATLGLTKHDTARLGGDITRDRRGRPTGDQVQAERVGQRREDAFAGSDGGAGVLGLDVVDQLVVLGECGVFEVPPGALAEPNTAVIAGWLTHSRAP